MDNKITTVKERILEVAKNKGISIEKFVSELGMTYGNFKGSAKKRPINSDTIEKIFTIYPEIDLEWLLTGEGEMMKKSIGKGNAKQVYKLRTDRDIDSQQIPLYNLEASAGLVDLFQHHDSSQPIDTIRIPNLPKCDGAVFVTGDSMYPLLKSGDIIAYKEIQDFKTDIFWGEMYLISVEVSGEEWISVKYIQKSDEGEEYIKLVSQNQNHQPKDVKLDKVRALAIIKASIRINSMS